MAVPGGIFFCDSSQLAPATVGLFSTAISIHPHPSTPQPKLRIFSRGEVDVILVLFGGLQRIDTRCLRPSDDWSRSTDGDLLSLDR